MEELLYTLSDRERTVVDIVQEITRGIEVCLIGSFKRFACVITLISSKEGIRGVLLFCDDRDYIRKRIVQVKVKRGFLSIRLDDILDLREFKGTREIILLP